MFSSFLCKKKTKRKASSKIEWKYRKHTNQIKTKLTSTLYRDKILPFLPRFARTCSSPASNPSHSPQSEMRPFPGDDIPPGRVPRVSDSDAPSTFGLPPGPQMTYFFADESSIGSTPTLTHHRSKENRKVSGCAESSEVRSRGGGGGGMSQPHLDNNNNLKDDGSRPGSSSRGCGYGYDDDTLSRLPPPMTPPFRPISNPSGPVTPIMLGTSGPASALSSVSSRRNSFAGSLSEDILGSQVPSSMVDGEGGPGDSMPVSMMDSGSAPQLIMPSIKMPSRRPFTDEGKAMGRLKVMIAGESGIGKTSLVKAIVQSCEHIVHVDPIGPSMASSSMLRPATTRNRNSPGNGGGGGRRRSEGGTSQITEIYASTKPYPEWWSEIDDFRVLRRRKSLGDTVLDRNICFVDTPGWGSLSSVCFLDRSGILRADWLIRMDI